MGDQKDKLHRKWLRKAVSVWFKTVSVWLIAVRLKVLTPKTSCFYCAVVKVPLPAQEVGGLILGHALLKTYKKDTSKVVGLALGSNRSLWQLVSYLQDSFLCVSKPIFVSILLKILWLYFVDAILN